MTKTYDCPIDGVPKIDRRLVARNLRPEPFIEHLFNGFHNVLENVASSESNKYWNGYVSAMMRSLGEINGRLMPASVWRPMSEAPLDRKIVAWCVHEETPYTDPAQGQRLSLYEAHAEGLSHCEDGPHVLEFGGGWADSVEDGGGALPDWWFVTGTSFEIAANPIAWMEITAERPDLATQAQLHPLTSFDEAWKGMQARGYQYGEDALQGVHLGYEMARHQLAGTKPEHWSLLEHTQQETAMMATDHLAQVKETGLQLCAYLLDPTTETLGETLGTLATKLRGLLS